MKQEDTQKKDGVIMVVDDEDNVLHALERSLRRLGYRVITCSRAEEALGILDQEQVDVVISDYLMPGMKGMDFLVRVRAGHPNVVRILLTGHADVEVAIAGINSGKLYRFLTKPWDDDELRATISRAVAVARLQQKSRSLIKEAKKRKDYVDVLEKKHPGISKVKRDRTGAIIIED